MQVNLCVKSLKITFLIALLFTVTTPLFLPSWRLLFFIPFLVIALYQKPLQTCLIYSFFTGLILDLLVGSHPIGIFALSFSFSTLLLFSSQRHFFADNISTLPVVTFFFSCLSTAFYAGFVYIVDMQKIVTMKWILTDLIVMPLADMLYAFTLFTLPALLLGKRRLSGDEYFLDTK